MSDGLKMLNRPIGPIAYGSMGLTWRPNPPSQEVSFATFRAALSSGANFWNGGELYGTPTFNSNTLLKAYFEKYPDDADRIVYCLKGGLNPAIPGINIDGSEKNIRRSVEDSLRQLKGDDLKGPGRIDIFECGRVDKKVPIEEQMRVLNELKNEGKIGGISLSEAGPDTIRRAAKVAKIELVEVELSMFSLDILYNGIVSTCQDLDIPILAYSAVGRGMLAGNYPKSNAEIPDGDNRKGLPKFQDDVLENNYKLVAEVKKIAEKKGCTVAQVAIGWLLKLNHSTLPDGKTKVGTIIPLPGASAPERAEENSKVVRLTDEEMKELWDVIEKNPVLGDRLSPQFARFSEY